MDDTARAIVIVSGRVQGVWFRQSTMDEARSIGVGGWVRNLPDGRVEAAFEGARGRVEQALAWIAQGPPRARVDDVEVTWETPQGEEDFTVR